jgi:hypothetical protein
VRNFLIYSKHQSPKLSFSALPDLFSFVVLVLGLQIYAGRSGNITRASLKSYAHRHAPASITFAVFLPLTPWEIGLLAAAQ